MIAAKQITSTLAIMTLCCARVICPGNGAGLASTVAANKLCNSFTAFNTNYHDTGLFGVVATAENNAPHDDLAWAIMHEARPAAMPSAHSPSVLAVGDAPPPWPLKPRPACVPMLSGLSGAGPVTMLAGLPCSRAPA